MADRHPRKPVTWHKFRCRTKAVSDDGGSYGEPLCARGYWPIPRKVLTTDSCHVVRSCSMWRMTSAADPNDDSCVAVAYELVRDSG